MCKLYKWVGLYVSVDGQRDIQRVPHGLKCSEVTLRAGVAGEGNSILRAGAAGRYVIPCKYTEVRLVLKLVVRSAYQIFFDTQSPCTMKTPHIHCCDISVCTVACLAAMTAIIANYTLSLCD